MLIPSFLYEGVHNLHHARTRYGTADEVAATGAFLVSNGAAYIAGQSLRVDGGITRAV